jgi:hypothetical protein
MAGTARPWYAVTAPRGTSFPGRMRLGALVNWAGALMSLGLVVGMGVWALQLA